MKTCLIVTGGSFCPLPGPIPEADLIIACDRGWRYAEQLGLRPDLIIGDFDSAEAPEDPTIPVQRYPSEKDDTDTMLAVKYALAQGCSTLHILFALGGRMDHAYANIQSAAYGAEAGACTVLWGERDILTAFPASRRKFPRREGWSLSVFALSGRCTGVAISGARYTAEGVELVSSFPLGTSNAWAAEQAVISAETGCLLVIESRLEPGEHN